MPKSESSIRLVTENPEVVELMAKLDRAAGDWEAQLRKWRAAGRPFDGVPVRPLPKLRQLIHTEVHRSWAGHHPIVELRSLMAGLDRLLPALTLYVEQFGNLGTDEGLGGTDTAQFLMRHIKEAAESLGEAYAGVQVMFSPALGNVSREEA